ncbi:Myosin-17 [Vitis vinifera]|uniref:Myosin-17 n=1 Tax=Vitis vinifera TaxID=29760 RepID=A0A438DSE8_VITVI|nr:Myosin-17 [Vitis vinifera]
MTKPEPHMGSTNMPLFGRVHKSVPHLLDIVTVQVPPFLVCKVFTQIFSFIDVQLFNSGIFKFIFAVSFLRRECCSFSNGEFVKTGLAELENLCHEATKEYVGSAWDELSISDKQLDSWFDSLI